ncbi:UNVERIFIED_CONTAM: zinc finger protein [Trichonephila clavipes]
MISCDEENMFTSKNCKNGLRVYFCRFCSYSTPFKGTIKRHALTHSGIRPFECNICHKAFNRKTSLKRHSKLHSGERPYKCDICKISFSRSNALSCHKMKHMEGFEQVLFTTDQTASTLTYSCTNCTYSTTSKRSINKHVKEHITAKLFVCEVCHRVFSRKDTLARHFRIHSGERPFKYR